MTGSKLSECQGCVLKDIRIQVVLGNGASPARVMFVGQAPGKEEDRQGIPFIGPAGQKLRSIILPIGLRKGEYYITNACKCYPGSGPDGRDNEPSDEVLEACKKWLDKEFKVVRPRLVVLLGGVALKTVLGDKYELKKKHGELLYSEEDKRFYYPMYHPANVTRGRFVEEFSADRDKLKEVIRSCRKEFKWS